MTEVAAEYRRRADAFERLIAGTPQDRWAAPSPCAGWTASDVVAHVVDFAADVLRERAAVDDAPRFADFAGPLDAFRATRAVVERLLEDPATVSEVATYVRWSLSFELPQHGWDLATATGQDATIAPDEVELLWGRATRTRLKGRSAGSARTAGTARRSRPRKTHRCKTASSACWGGTPTGPRHERRPRRLGTSLVRDGAPWSSSPPKRESLAAYRARHCENGGNALGLVAPQHATAAAAGA